MTKSLPLKFSVGFVAGLCAAFFPRLIAELATASNNDAIALFNQNYIVLSLVFSVLIGAVITILEWEGSRSPKDIFMSALAIPGVLSGALNTTASVKEVEQVEKEKTMYENMLEETYDIPILDSTMLSPISKATVHENHQLSLFFMSNAYADEGDFYRVGGYGFGIRREQSVYVVVLDKANSRSEAERKAADLRNRVPVKIFRGKNKQFFITTGSGMQKKTTALLEAVRLKKKESLSPKLLKLDR